MFIISETFAPVWCTKKNFCKIEEREKNMKFFILHSSVPRLHLKNRQIEAILFISVLKFYFMAA